MIKAAIVGAGSAGNHLAFACREARCQLTVVDSDQAALERMRGDIFPGRYGAWDDAISLRFAAERDALSDAVSGSDVVVLATPPDTHLAIVRQLLETSPPRVLLVEKPLCRPDEDSCVGFARLASANRQTRILVGYNHLCSQTVTRATDAIRSDALGAAQTLRVRWVEHWAGIFRAHPWLAGPGESYLGDLARGGGALGEHSHGLNLWQHVAHVSGAGRVAEVSCDLDLVAGPGLSYDRIAQLSLRCESGLIGSVIQDVVSDPPCKQLDLVAERGTLALEIGAREDAMRLCGTGVDSPVDARSPKVRPDDFRGEIAHVLEILEDPKRDSPLALERGLETMLVAAAARRAHALGRRVAVDYQAIEV